MMLLGEYTFQLYQIECEVPYSEQIGSRVPPAFLKTKLLELESTSLSRIVHLKLDFFNMLVHYPTRSYSFSISYLTSKVRIP